MMSRTMLAIVAASLVAVATAAPDINVVVGNFALNLVCSASMPCPHVHQ